MMIHFYKVVSFYDIRVPPYVDFLAVVSDMILMAPSSDMYCRYFDMIASGGIASTVLSVILWLLLVILYVVILCIVA